MLLRDVKEKYVIMLLEGGVALFSSFSLNASGSILQHSNNFISQKQTVTL